jgi:phosphatidylinositol glycan class B
MSMQHLDSPALIALAPRLLHGLLAAMTDCFSLDLYRTVCGDTIAHYALLTQLASWFNMYAIPRSLSNSLETCVCIMAMCKWAEAMATRKDFVSEHIFT